MRVVDTAGNRLENSSESGFDRERPRLARKLLRRRRRSETPSPNPSVPADAAFAAPGHDAAPAAQNPTSTLEASEVTPGQVRPAAGAGDREPAGVLSAGDPLDARRTAMNLVTQGRIELLRARAEAARIQAEARERLVEVMEREAAVAEMARAKADDASSRSIEAAQQQAAEIVAEARATAVRLLEEAQQLLAASRRQAPLSPGSQTDPLSTRQPSIAGDSEPRIVIDLTKGDRASRYARRSAHLPTIGDEAEHTLARLSSLRPSRKGPTNPP